MQRPGFLWILSLLSTCIAPPGLSAAEAPSQDKVRGPGDRPSVCYERAIEYITPNLDQMTTIADLLLAEKAVDEAGVIRYRDGSTKLHMAYGTIPLEHDKKMRARFAALFDGLIVNSFTPWVFFEYEEYVIAQPGLYDPPYYVVPFRPWCGGTDEEWRSGEKVTGGILLGRGGPISYQYDPEGMELEIPCSDEIFLNQKKGECELRLNEHWAIEFFYINQEQAGE